VGSWRWYSPRPLSAVVDELVGLSTRESYRVPQARRAWAVDGIVSAVWDVFCFCRWRWGTREGRGRRWREGQAFKEAGWKNEFIKELRAILEGCPIW